MTLTACDICAVFATGSFNFSPPTYFISHYCCKRALHKKRIAGLFDYGMSKVTHMLHGVYGVDTTDVYVC